MERRIVTPEAEALNKGRLNAARQALRQQDLAILIGRSEINMLTDFGQVSAAITLDQLGISQPGVDHPMATALAPDLHPLPEMGRQRIEIECQTVA